MPESSIGERVEVVMRRMPAIRGRVVHEDAGVPDARVRLLKTSPPEEMYVANGFRLRFLTIDPEPETRTDAEGRFVLAPAVAGRFVVQALPASLSIAMSEEITLVAEGADVDVTIDVPDSGGIEGTVTRTDGGTVADWYVLVSCGDGVPATTRTDARGRYRFDGLAPGGWQVRSCGSSLEARFGAEHNERYLNRAAPPIRWDCFVEAGRTTRHDIELPPASDAEIELGPPFDVGAWNASVTLECMETQSPADPSVGLRAEGGKRVASFPCSGKGSLSVQGTRGEGECRFQLPLDLKPGHNVLRIEVPTGSLSGKLHEGGQAVTALELTWKRASDGASAWMRLSVAADGSFSARCVPTGPCALVVRGVEGTRERSVEIPTGSELDLGTW